MKFNIKTIITAERLLNKPFSDFDFLDEEDLKTLVYAVYLNEQTITFGDFEKLWSLKSERIKMEKFITTQILYLHQFSEPDENKSGEKVWITSLVNRLITTGKVDQSYILNEMKLWELNELLKAAEEAIKTEMEDKRFWAYISILPHVDGKKLKKPQDLIVFPWEKAKFEQESKEKLERDKKMFEKFFNSKPL